MPPRRSSRVNARAPPPVGGANQGRRRRGPGGVRMMRDQIMLGVVQLLHRHRADELVRRREEVRRGLMRLRRGLGMEYEQRIAAESPEQLVARMRPSVRASMRNTMFDIRFGNPVRQSDVSVEHPYDMQPYFDHMRVNWKAQIRKKMREYRSSYKVSIRILLDQVKATDPTVTRQKWIETQTDRVDNLAQVDTVVDIFILYLTAMMETWAANPTEGSDFVIRDVIASVVDMAAVANNAGNVRGSGMDWSSMVMGHWYPMPKWLQDKKACIVIKNEDEFCFRYCMELAWMIQHEGKPDHPERVSTYQIDHFDYAGIEFPFKVADIAKFLKVNKHRFPGLTIHVYYLDINPGEDGREAPQRPFEPIFPLDRGQREPGDFHVDLLTTWKEDTGEAHCMLITSMSRLLARGEAARNGKRFHCPMCNNLYWSEEALNRHVEGRVCSNNPACAEIFPYEEKPTKSFRNFHHLIRKPFVIYADFEALILPMSDEEKGEVGHGVVDRHHPCGYAFHTECAYDRSLCRTVLRRARSADENIGALMVASLRREAERVRGLMERLNFPVHPTQIPPMVRVQGPSEKCRACGTSLRYGEMDEWLAWNSGGKIKGKLSERQELENRVYCRKPVFAHNGWLKENNHIGWVHTYCRDKLELYKTVETFIPVVFHNLRGYDGHIVLRNIEGSTIDHCIPQDGDKFMSFEMDGMRFIDSLCFLTQSLDKLVSNLARDGIAGFDILRCNMRGYRPEQVALLMKKGIYPYEYMDSVARFDEAALPPKSAFFSSLMNQGIGDAEYEHAGAVWRECEIKTMGEYHDLYLMTDVLNLACVFERFRSICVSQSGVDPTYFYSTPGYTQEACLRFCEPILHRDCESPFEIQLFNASDEQREMYRFCERGIRGGISMIPNRHSVANNPMMPDFDMVRPKTWIQYYDVTNLYGWAMSQPMPIGKYEWEITHHHQDHWSKEAVLELKDDAEIGYIFEVDLVVNAEHHDRLRDYPMAPEPMEPKEEWLSDYSRQKLHECGKEFTSTKKLVCSFLPKTKYVCHYRNLKLYLQHGYTLLRVHRVLQFEQSCWLKPYIDFNTSQRAKSTSEMEKDYYKLMVNSCFGKFIQNDRKFRQVEIVTDPERAERLTNKPTFKNKRHITDRIVAIETHKTRVTLNQAVIVGMAILDVSKVRMYDFYYSVLKDTFGDRVRLLMTDTDSLCVEITSDDPTVELTAFKGQFDTAEMPKDHPWFTLANKKVVGTMKDEVMVDHQWITIERFTGLRAKMYALTKTSPDAAVRERLKEKKVCKGISRSVIQNKLTYAMYETVMRDPVSSSQGWNQHTMRNIQSQNNVSYTTQITKVALTALDDKLYQVDGVRTLPYGHYSLGDVAEAVPDRDNQQLSDFLLVQDTGEAQERQAGQGADLGSSDGSDDEADWYGVPGAAGGAGGEDSEYDERVHARSSEGRVDDGDRVARR